MTNAFPNCRSCARQATVREALRALFIAGNSMATSRAMMPMTTNSSTRVNPRVLCGPCREVVILPPRFEGTRIFGSANNFRPKREVCGGDCMRTGAKLKMILKNSGTARTSPPWSLGGGKLDVQARKAGALQSNARCHLERNLDDFRAIVVIDPQNQLFSGLPKQCDAETPGPAAGLHIGFAGQAAVLPDHLFGSGVQRFDGTNSFTRSADGQIHFVVHAHGWIDRLIGVQNRRQQ